jgi:YD repeat-containing protein
LTSSTDRDGRRIDNTYDDAGGLITAIWYDNTETETARSTFSYDSNILTATNGNNRVTGTNDTSRGDVLTMTDDSVGTRIKVQDNLSGMTSLYDTTFQPCGFQRKKNVMNHWRILVLLSVFCIKAHASDVFLPGAGPTLATRAVRKDGRLVTEQVWQIVEQERKLTRLLDGQSVTVFRADDTPIDYKQLPTLLVTHTPVLVSFTGRVNKAYLNAVNKTTLIVVFSPMSEPPPQPVPQNIPNIPIEKR